MNKIILITVVMIKKTSSGDYFALTEETEKNTKVPRSKNGARVKITSFKHIFSKGYIKYWSR